MTTARDRLNRKFDQHEFRAWWNEDSDDEAARVLYSMAESIETASSQRRLQNSLFYTLVTNRPAPASMGAWMGRRALPRAQAFGRTSYTRPHTNLVGECADTFSNRIGTVRPFVQVIPVNGEFATRESCRMSENYIEAIFDKTRFYESILPVMYDDSGKWGIGWGKVSGNKARKQVNIERVLDDELLFDEDAALTGRIPYLIQRVAITRSDVLETYGDVDGIEEAVSNAPPMFLSQYGNLVPNDLICVLESWLPNSTTGASGQRLLALPNLALERETYDYDDYPFFNVKWENSSVGYRPQGLAEKLAPVQLVINRKDGVIEEGEHHSRMHWLAEMNSEVTERNLGNLTAGVIAYRGVKPDPITVEGVPPSVYASKEQWVAWGRQRVGLNEQLVSGEKPEGVNSGKGLRIVVQIADGRHKSSLLSMEDGVEACARLVMRVAAEVKPTVEISGTQGREMRWHDLKAEAGKIRVYPISGLSLTPADRAQEIEEQYAAGTIDKRTYFRLRSMPDVQSFVRLATAHDDLIEDTLDNIVRDAKFHPPEPYDDLDAALRMASSRYALEKRLMGKSRTEKRNRQVLAALQDFMFAVQDQQKNAAAPAMPGAMPGAALGAPAGPVPGLPGAPGIQPPALPGAPLGPAGEAVATPPGMPGMGGADQLAMPGQSDLGMAVAGV